MQIGQTFVLQVCFNMDPTDRFNCEQLLEHPYFDKRFAEMFNSKTEDERRAERELREERRKRMQEKRANNNNSQQKVRKKRILFT